MDLEKLVEGAGKSVFPLAWYAKTFAEGEDPMPDLSNLPGLDKLEDAAEKLGELVALLMALFLPQEVKVYRTEEYLKTIPALTETIYQDKTRTFANPAWLQWRKDWDAAIEAERAKGYSSGRLSQELAAIAASFRANEPPKYISHTRSEAVEIVTVVPERTVTATREVEDSLRGFTIGSWRAFKTWSSIPILQMLALAGITAATLPALIRTVPELTKQLEEGVIDVVSRST